jgi:3-hydroxyacyl-CoA dehydrogenase
MSNIAVADSVQVRAKAPEVQSNQKDTRVTHHRINKVAVLGAGTMGSRIAAHLANAGIPCYLLDIVPPDQAQSSDKSARNKIVAAGLDGAIKSKPAAFFQKGLERLVTVGNFDDDLKLLADADWIIEAVAENLEIKRNLLKKV